MFMFPGLIFYEILFLSSIYVCVRAGITNTSNCPCDHNSLAHVISSFSGPKLSHLSVKGTGLDQDGQAYGTHVLTALSLDLDRHC